MFLSLVLMCDENLATGVEEQKNIFYKREKHLTIYFKLKILQVLKKKNVDWLPSPINPFDGFIPKLFWLKTCLTGF